MDQFEEMICALTQPINDQLPRPWMTDLKNPLEAKVFIVGMNQRNPYSAQDISHRRHMDALFNRNGESCRGLYDEVTNGKPSPTRRNIDGLSARLKQRDIHKILETDAVCYSTPLGRDLRERANAVAAKNGEEIFRFLIAQITPKVLLVHGVGAAKRVSRMIGIDRPRVPRSVDEMCDVQTEHLLVITIPSLAPPGFNMWSSWSDRYLDKVADRVQEKLTTL